MQGKLSAGRNCAAESGLTKVLVISIRLLISPSGSCGVLWGTRLRIRDSSRLFQNVAIALSRTCQSSMQTPAQKVKNLRLEIGRVQTLGKRSKAPGWRLHPNAG